LGRSSSFVITFLLARRADHQDRPSTRAYHLISHAAHHSSIQTRPPMGAHSNHAIGLRIGIICYTKLSSGHRTCRLQTLSRHASVTHWHRRLWREGDNIWKRALRVLRPIQWNDNALYQSDSLERIRCYDPSSQQSEIKDYPCWNSKLPERRFSYQRPGSCTSLDM
jgi:hypothetical protein